MSVDLRAKPFYLNDEQVAWVEKTWEEMTLDEKIGQLFCAMVTDFSENSVQAFLSQNFGAFMVRPMPFQGIQENVEMVQQRSKIPMLVGANLENGGIGAFNDGTLYSMPMGACATGDPETGYRLGKISTAEAASVGINWGFAPIVDLDLNYHNPITNIRAFSSKKEDVISWARGYLRAAKEEAVIPALKHFPGDGADERDQHLLVSVNTLSAEDWMESYGAIYKTLIDEGVPTVMVGHIAQPAMARAADPSISDWEATLPASQSKALLTGVLREKLGFNGLAITDSTLMVGFLQKMPRKEALCVAIEGGIDMILFNRNIAEDFGYMKAGYEAGKISDERLHDAVLRILATKASLNLHLKKQSGRIVPDVDPATVIGNATFQEWVKDCADKAVTLVKNKNVLPLSPEKCKRIYLNVIENKANDKSPFAADMAKRLSGEGFEVTLRKREINVNMEDMIKGIMSEDMLRIVQEISATTEQFVSQYDMAMIVLNMPTESNATVVRVNWSVIAGMGNDIPWYAGELPLVVVSFANPYHLLDIPMADAYVNAYTDNEATRNAVFDKLMGRSPFKGISPVDAFCSHEDCRV